MRKLRKLINEQLSLDEATNNNAELVGKNVVAPDVNSREPMGAVAGQPFDTIDDPDGLPNHLLDPVMDPKDCWGPVPPTSEKPSVSMDPFVNDAFM